MEPEGSEGGKRRVCALEMEGRVGSRREERGKGGGCGGGGLWEAGREWQITVVKESFAVNVNFGLFGWRGELHFHQPGSPVLLSLNLEFAPKCPTRRLSTENHLPTEQV